jgi:hypothetical protein
MSNSGKSWTTQVLLAGAGLGGTALLLLAGVTLVNRGTEPPDRRPSEAIKAAYVVEAGKPASDTRGGSAKRFTLRLGQGFRFKDGAVVVGSNQDERPDIVFKYLPPHVGGMALRYNEISQQVETGMEPTLTAAVPLLVSTHIRAFDQRPDVARITSGDAVGYFNQAPIGGKTHYVLLMNAAGEQYFLTLEKLEAETGKYDDWRIGFAYEPVQLPLGLAGGRINKPLPGKLIFRDWYRSKMIVRVDLTTGREEAIADGTLPTTAGQKLMGFGDASSAYIVRDEATGKTLHTMRFNEQVMGPVLSPDGTRLAATVYRAGPEQNIAGTKMPGRMMLSTAVFDLEGREVASIVGYDDATWTPDGKLIATAALYENGVFEIDPATKQVTAIDAQVACPLQPSVSPDGKTIAFVTGNRVWLIDRAGGGGRKNLRQLFLDGHNQQRPCFSPDGTKIALVICNTMAVDMTGEVFAIDLATQEITPLRTSAGLSLTPDTNTRLNWVP